MTNFDIISDITTTNKTILLLADMDVPLGEENEIINDQKIQQSMPTINYLVKTGARVVIATHLGNPINNTDVRFSTKPIAKYLDKRLRCNVKFCPTCVGDKSRKEIFHSDYGDVIVLENLLFYQEEKNCDINFARQLSDGMNIYVNDAFDYSGYPYASVLCVPLFIRAAAGLTLANNVQNLDFVLNTSNVFSTAIIGGKMTNKIDLLNNLIDKMNCIIVGGIVANNFFKAIGYEIGNSQFEPNCIEIADNMLKNSNNCSFIVPVDVSVSTCISQNNINKIKKVNEIEKNEMVIDIGPKSIENIHNILSLSKKIFFYGSTGINEINTSSNSTSVILNKIAQLTKNNHIFSAINGRDTILSANKCLDNFSFISKSTTSALQYMSNKVLPGIEILKRLSK